MEDSDREDPDVGRTGAEGGTLVAALEPVVELGSRHVLPDAHWAPFRQHPPPRVAGQENQPELQTKEEEDRVEEAVTVVGTTITAVDVRDVLVDEVDGLTNVMEVPATTPGQVLDLLFEVKLSPINLHPTS